jgi:hydrogenase/urease accessory protein HupE
LQALRVLLSWHANEQFGLAEGHAHGQHNNQRNAPPHRYSQLHGFDSISFSMTG